MIRRSRRWLGWWMAGCLLGNACAVSGEPPPLRAADVLPAFDGAVAWLNTSEPITRELMHGQVALVVFWSYSNVHALRVLPIVQAWYERYRGHGLELVSVHSPEFPFEAVTANVEASVRRLGVSFPVAVDSDRVLWTRFGCREWPSYYVADPDGALLGFQMGAGREGEVELYFRGLLEEDGRTMPPDVVVPSRSVPEQPEWSPEVLFGRRMSPRLASPQTVVFNEPRHYTSPTVLPVHSVALQGVWRVEEDRAIAWGTTCRMTVHYRAARCYLVAEGNVGDQLELRIDAGAVPASALGADGLVHDARSVVALDFPRVYHIVDHGARLEDRTIEILVPRGVSLYAFTFG